MAKKKFKVLKETPPEMMVAHRDVHVQSHKRLVVWLQDTLELFKMADLKPWMAYASIGSMMVATLTKLLRSGGMSKSSIVLLVEKSFDELERNEKGKKK